MYVSDDSPDEAKQGNGKRTQHANRKLNESRKNQSHSLQGGKQFSCKFYSWECKTSSTNTSNQNNAWSPKYLFC